jgi:hypothetical protein
MMPYDKSIEEVRDSGGTAPTPMRAHNTTNLNFAPPPFPVVTGIADLMLRPLRGFYINQENQCDS